MSVRVVSRRKGGIEATPGEVLVTIARPSILSNPFEMKEEGDRKEVCDKYEVYMRKRYEEDEAFNKIILKLARKHRCGARLALQCWCAPKRCHGDSLKKLIEEVAMKRR